MPSSLLWSDSLALGLDVMDETHREFVALLKLVDQAAESDLLPAWQRVVDHTQDHFDRQVMREVAHRVQQSRDLAMLREMSQQLGEWFLHHAQSMDAALALHLRTAGFDPLTGVVSMPEALPASVIHGCGGSVCSTTGHAVAGATA
ncbi:MAG: hemerythrin [Betaproteobacteria bacterium]|nr:hemerythrin [Betaproteobacteria bacterium]